MNYVESQSPIISAQSDYLGIVTLNHLIIFRHSLKVHIKSRYINMQITCYKISILL